MSKKRAKKLHENMFQVFVEHTHTHDGSERKRKMWEFVINFSVVVKEKMSANISYVFIGPMSFYRLWNTSGGLKSYEDAKWRCRHKLSPSNEKNHRTKK